MSARFLLFPSNGTASWFRQRGGARVDDCVDPIKTDFFRKAIRKLGEISVPSGTLIVIDTGLLKFWCHDRPPLMEEGDAPDQVVESANSSVDFCIEGKDAEIAGKQFDRQWHPTYLFDIPARGLEQVEQSFAQCIRPSAFDARLTRLPEKVTHRQRVSLALTFGHGAGEVFFQGITAPVLDGLPRDRALPVFGERMPAGSYDDRWRRVWLECQEDAKVAHQTCTMYVCSRILDIQFSSMIALALVKD